MRTRPGHVCAKLAMILEYPYRFFCCDTCLGQPLMKHKRIHCYLYESRLFDFNMSENSNDTELTVINSVAGTTISLCCATLFCFVGVKTWDYVCGIFLDISHINLSSMTRILFNPNLRIPTKFKYCRRARDWDTTIKMIQCDSILWHFHAHFTNILNH